MRRIKGLAVVAIFVLALAGVAVAAQKGSVGGLPTRHLNPPDEGKRLTPERVIASGKTYSGRLEIDAYGWQPPSEGEVEDAAEEGPSVCTWIEAPPGSFPFYGDCFAPAEISEPIKISGDTEERGSGRQRNTQVSGPAAAKVAKVVLFVRRPGKAVEKVDALVAQVSGALQKELGQTAPFSYFYGVIPGYVKTKYVEAVAYAAGGRKLGSTRGLSPIVVHD
jgi:hypothetical protein